MTSLFQHFAQYIRLNDELKEEITRRMHSQTFKKGTLIHDADKICVQSYFIRKGLMRLYFIKDGKEVSDYFGAEGEWVNSPRSMMFRKLDHYYIDALEDCEVFALSVPDLMYLFDQFPEMERYARLSMGSMFYQFMERITSLRFTTAKDKYEHFCQVYHGIYHRIPLGMVASYLGITQETLSRIRAQK